MKRSGMPKVNELGTTVRNELVKVGETAVGWRRSEAAAFNMDRLE